MSSSEQHHAVRSMRLDVRLADPRLAREVQEQLSQLTHRKLLTEMEAVFSQACVPGHTQSLEKLVVDLGVLRLEHLEEEILERFAPRLQEALVDALSASPEQGRSDPSDTAAGAEPSTLALLEHLLKHGTLPWWASAQAGTSLEDLFVELAARNPAAVEKIIRRLGSAQQVRLRLVRQFSPAVLAALVELLEPEDAAQILKCAVRLDVLHEQSPVVSVGQHEFYEAKWDLMLHTLLKEHGTRFNMKSFLRRNVAGLAQYFGIDYTTLIYHLAETGSDARTPEAPSMIETLLRELSSEAPLADPAFSSGKTALLKGSQAKGSAQADDPELLWEHYLRCFGPGSDEVDVGLAAGANLPLLVRAWRVQSRSWQRSLWEAILFRSRASEVAHRLVMLFPPEIWEEVQQTLPHPFDNKVLLTLQAGLSGLRPGVDSSKWSSLWWQQVFTLALEQRRSVGRGLGLGYGGQALSALLKAGLPQGVSLTAAAGLLLAQPAIQRHPLLRRALAPLARQHAEAENAELEALLRQDFRSALKLFGRWLQGAEWPPALQAALPGGPKAWLVRLELHHPAATRALLRMRSGSRHWQRLAARTDPSLRLRILFLLAPRTAPLLLATLETITQNRMALFGTQVSARRLEAGCWAALAEAIPAKGVEPGVNVTLLALRNYLNELARRSGMATLLLGERLHALMTALPAAAATALARWYPECSPGARRPSLSRAATALHDPRGWLEAWLALLGSLPRPQAGRDAFEALSAFCAQAKTPAAYHRMLLAALSERGVLERIVATGGEDFLLWVTTQQPERWRTELSAWLDLLEQTGAEAGVLRFAPREWRWRALQAVVVWHQRARLRTISPRALALELLRRLSASGKEIAAWKKNSPATLPAKGALLVPPAHPRRSPSYSPDLVTKLKLWGTFLAGGERGTLSASARTALWAAVDHDERFLYRELLETQAPDWRGLQRVLATGGETFFLWVAVNEPGRWRGEFSDWLVFLEQVAAAVDFLPFDRSEWRARALCELLLLDRQTSAHALRPGTVMLEVLRRLGVLDHVLGHWDVLVATLRGHRPELARLRRVPAFQALAMLLQAWCAAGAVRPPARISSFIHLTAKGGPDPAHPKLRNLTHVKTPEPKPQPRPRPLPQPPQPPEAGDDFYIENAGLVILAPFFSRYFETNGLMVDGLFRDQAAAERGVHLLQVLLTEGTVVPEQALVLNKVLCGLSPGTPVVRGIDCTEAERTLASILLQSAIQNWPSVGDLSLDGFRGSFLWRKGKLTRGDERWTLTIEHRGYDVLFSSLPWSFSVIKPLWMPDPLYVDWV